MYSLNTATPFTDMTTVIMIQCLMCCGNANGYHNTDAYYKTYVADDHYHICDDNYTIEF